MGFTCPWPCVSDATVPPTAQQQQQSFAQVLSPVTMADNVPLPLPTIRGDNLSICITEDVYIKGLEKCRHNMHGRLFLNKGDKSYSTKEIIARISKLWKTKGSWEMISLGRGFYEFSFSSSDDLRTSLALGTVNLKPGLLRFSRWSKDFNKYAQRLTYAQVWICLLDLPQEYWLKRTLMEIFGAIGTPLIIDAATKKRSFDHYARILVDVDFSRRLFYEIMVERGSFAFPVEVEYKWLPDFSHIVR
jgi:hypothetical protein